MRLFRRSLIVLGVAASLPTVVFAAVGMFYFLHAQRNLGADYVRQFDGIYPRLAKETGVLFYPFILDGVAMDPALNQGDGIHPNKAGAAIVAKKLLPVVEKALPAKS